MGSLSSFVAFYEHKYRKCSEDLEAHQRDVNSAEADLDEFLQFTDEGKIFKLQFCCHSTNT